MWELFFLWSQRNNSVGTNTFLRSQRNSSVETYFLGVPGGTTVWKLLLLRGLKGNINVETITFYGSYRNNNVGTITSLRSQRNKSVGTTTYLGTHWSVSRGEHCECSPCVSDICGQTQQSPAQAAKIFYLFFFC